MMGCNDKMYKIIAGGEHKVYAIPVVNGPIHYNTLREGDLITITEILQTPHGVFGKLSQQTLDALYFESSIGYVLLSSGNENCFQEVTPF